MIEMKNRPVVSIVLAHFLEYYMQDPLSQGDVFPVMMLFCYTSIYTSVRSVAIDLLERATVYYPSYGRTLRDRLMLFCFLSSQKKASTSQNRYREQGPETSRRPGTRHLQCLVTGSQYLMPSCSSPEIPCSTPTHRDPPLLFWPLSVSPRQMRG